MAEVTPRDRKAILRLSQKYGIDGVIAVAKTASNVLGPGAPADPDHNCAAVWAFIEFLKNYRIVQKKKKFELALAMGQEVLAKVTPRSRPFTYDALRNLYYEAKRRADEPTIKELKTNTYAHYVATCGSQPLHIVPVPILARSQGGHLASPWIDTEFLDKQRV